MAWVANEVMPCGSKKESSTLRKYDDGFEDTDTDFGDFIPLPSFLSCIFTVDAFSL